jgi:hypothetical protein
VEPEPTRNRGTVPARGRRARSSGSSPPSRPARIEDRLPRRDVSCDRIAGVFFECTRSRFRPAYCSLRSPFRKATPPDHSVGDQTRYTG